MSLYLRGIIGVCTNNKVGEIKVFGLTAVYTFSDKHGKIVTLLFFCGALVWHYNFLGAHVMCGTLTFWDTLCGTNV